MKAIWIFLAFLTLSAASNAAGIEGFWRGTATRGGEATDISLHIENGPQGVHAHYNLPVLSVEGMPLSKFNYEASTGAITAGRTFKGQLSGDRITGELFPVLVHGRAVRVDLQRVREAPELKTAEREVQFVSRGNVLKGWLISPRGRGRYPAMVSLHGSGPSTRWLALARARRFAEAGYAMLIFDKPGSGESEGDWTMTSLDEMAVDAIAAAKFLETQPEVNPRKVGLWGHSQAGQVISRVGGMSNPVDFAIVLAGGGATSRRVEDYGYMGRLRQHGASPTAVEKAMAWVRDYYDYVRTGLGYDALSARLSADKDQEWAKALGVSTVYPTPEQQPKWSWVATYDPQADIRKIRFPVLLLFADKDRASPTQESLAAWRSALAAGGNSRVEWKIFEDAEHHFLTPAVTSGWPRMSPGYYETQIDWLNRMVGR